MPEPLAPALESLRTELLAADRLVRAVAAGRRRGVPPPAHRKVELRYVDLQEGRRLQVVRYDERQAFTQNLDAAQAPAAVDELLAAAYGNWHVDTTEASTQLRVTKKGEAQVHTGAAAPNGASTRQHDRTKPTLLDPGEPFLRALGITDAQGRVKPSRTDKLRQVEELLRALDPVLDRLDPVVEAHGVLRVADLGCGNGYLTLATYRRLTQRYGEVVDMVGVDAKEQSRAHGTALAAELGWQDGLRFVASGIGEVALDPPPHLVLALHACDTATDDALARAVRWQAEVVLAAPCCHHEVQAQLRQASTPEPYALLTRHGILRERFADGLTDALRASALRLLGYRVEVLEFVDSRHTPRNVLLRAVRTGAPPSPEVARDHRALLEAWGVRPALDRVLAPELAAATGPRGHPAPTPDDHGPLLPSPQQQRPMITGGCSGGGAHQPYG